MPAQITAGTAGGTVYASPFVGPNEHPIPKDVDIDSFNGSDWIDEKGWLKPGTPITNNNTPPDATVGEKVVGCLFEARKVAATSVAADLTAAGNLPLILSAFCIVNRDILEDNLGRALNADELAAFAAADNVQLTDT